MSNAQSIFSSNYAIRLARDMAESRQVMGPAETFRRLIIFSGIGIVSLLSGVVAIVLLNTELAIDTNSRTFLLFLSLASALVLIATIGASLLFLWDSFLGQYVQRLAMLDEDVDILSENDDDVFEIPVLRSEDLVRYDQEHIAHAFSKGSEDMAMDRDVDDLVSAFTLGSNESVLDVSVVVHDKKWVKGHDISTMAVRDQLIALSKVTSSEDWEKLGFDKHLDFFRGLGQTATVRTTFNPIGQAAISYVLVSLADPILFTKFFDLNTLANQLNLIPPTLNKKLGRRDAHTLRPNVA